MSQLILHHYPTSPFSEKVRTMLGYTGLAWDSALTREMPPRPVLEQLAGGYRKIPVVQIGADVFCDTHAIASEIARLSGQPQLAVENCSAEVQSYIDDVDLNVFFACLMASGTKTLGRKMWQSMGFVDMTRFIWDRIDIGRKASARMVKFSEAKARTLEHLAKTEARLEQQDFLFGEQPNHADFSAYHSLWFVRELAESPLMDEFERVKAWMDRIKAFGHGKQSEISAEQALETARDNTPRVVDDAFCGDPLHGKNVQIAPSDYGQIPTAGQLVGSTPTRWILARTSQETGTLHVHFPKSGFELTPT